MTYYPTEREEHQWALESEYRRGWTDALAALSRATMKILTPESRASLVAAITAGLPEAREAGCPNADPTHPDGENIINGPLSDPRA